MPWFVAKTESVSNPIPRFFIIKSLQDFAANLPEDLLLCPVRALNIYLNSTSSLIGRASSLFVSPSRTSHAISKNAISYFLRNIISSAGASGADEGPAPRAHSVRSVATSLAFLRN